MGSNNGVNWIVYNQIEPHVYSFLLWCNLVYWLIFCQPETATIERRMADREGKIKKLRDQQNTVEDEIFTDFCAQIGVSNIRSEDSAHDI